MSTTPVPVVAVDFGATAVRVCVIDVAARQPRLETIHRASHGPVPDGSGTLRWDWDRLVAGMERGLERAVQCAPIASIGIDAWGVDYGLIDDRGVLIEPPVSYRDARTRGYRDVIARIGAERLYGISGLQMMPINTIFQLAVQDADSLRRARHVVMLPELLAYHLTGNITAELTSAGTTGLLDLATADWSDELADAIAVPRRLLPPLQRPGALVGRWRGVPVHLVGGHDTASAVLGGGVEGAAFVSAGTWLLVGREQEQPDVSDWARTARFTNEQGAAGGIRLLRNVAGWWLVEECRRAWGGADLERLLAEAAGVEPAAVADATDERFLAPADMPIELISAAGLRPDASPGEVVRCAVESMASSTAAIIRQLDRDHVHVFGGGSQSPLYIEALGRHSSCKVTVGPVEATAIGNALAQALTLGVFEDVRTARAALAGTADGSSGVPVRHTMEAI